MKTLDEKLGFQDEIRITILWAQGSGRNKFLNFRPFYSNEWAGVGGSNAERQRTLWRSQGEKKNKKFFLPDPWAHRIEYLTFQFESNQFLYQANRQAYDMSDLNPKDTVSEIFVFDDNFSFFVM